MGSRQHRRPLSGGTGVNGGAGSGGYSTGSVASRDGTVIGCRQVGQGPGIIAVHGGMQAAQNLMKLAHALADSFTVHGEPEPAPRGPDIHRYRTRRQAQLSDQVKQQARAARRQAVVQRFGEGLILGEGRPVAVQLLYGRSRGRSDVSVIAAA